MSEFLRWDVAEQLNCNTAIKNDHFHQLFFLNHDSQSSNTDKDVISDWGQIYFHQTFFFYNSLLWFLTIIFQLSNLKEKQNWNCWITNDNKKNQSSTKMTYFFSAFRWIYVYYFCIQDIHLFSNNLVLNMIFFFFKLSTILDGSVYEKIIINSKIVIFLISYLSRMKVIITLHQFFWFIYLRDAIKSNTKMKEKPTKNE